MWSNPQFPEDLVTFTEEMLNGKVDFLFSVLLCNINKESFVDYHTYLNKTI